MQDQRKQGTAARPLAGEDGVCLSAREVMARLGVSKAEAYRLMKSELPSARFGGLVRVRVGDLDAWVARQIVPPLRKGTPK